MLVTTKKERLNKKDIILLIDCWMAPSLLYFNLDRSIPKKFGYIHFHYSGDILTNDPKLTKKNCLKFQKEIEKNVEKLNKKNLFIYAQSLGSIFAFMLTKKYDVKKVILIVPGDNLAESFWKGKLTQNLKNSMSKKGNTLNELKKHWETISPDYNIVKNQKTEYLIELSTIDKVIPYKQGERLVSLLEENNIKYKVLKDRKHTHIFKTVYETLFPKNIFKYFKK